MHRLMAIVLMLGLALVGCRKPKVYNVEGNIKEFYSQAAIEGAEVEIAYAQINYGSVSGGYTVISSSQTDANGNFALEFDYLSAAGFRVRVRKDGYFMGEELLSPASWSTDEINVVDKDIYKAAGLSITVRNQSLASAQIILGFDKHSDGCLYCCPSSNSYLFEGKVDTTIECAVYGGQYISYQVTKTWPGNASIEEGGVQVDQGDYRIEINF